MKTFESPTIRLACDLIEQASITPNDVNCQAIMIERLNAIGFECQVLNFDDVTNFWAIRKGTLNSTSAKNAKTLAFAGHTDVVPTGPENQWHYSPFKPTIKDGMLYGRGAADMKGSLAAMITACESFIKHHPHHKHNIAFLITSDEEGIAINGTVKVVEWLKSNNMPLEYCIVGEPSSKAKIGDIIKNGRRGSLNGQLTIYGKQGHIAYPQLAKNPIHLGTPFIAELAALEWDQGNKYFQPTSFQLSNINAGTGATNVIPGELNILFNFRYSTETTADKLKSTVEQLIKTYSFDYQLKWSLSGEPFLTEIGDLTHAVQQAIYQETGYSTELSTSGGTSDGRFIAKLGTQIIELGPCNATIHQINEHISIDDLNSLSKIYQNILTHIIL